MNITELKAQIKHGESESLEFKTSTGSISSGMQTICALLNSERGGKVIFGVKDNGSVVGQEVTDKTRKEIAAEVYKIEPYIKIAIDYVPVSEQLYVIVFDVQPGEKAPYLYDGRAFIRNQSTTMRMPKEEYLLTFNRNVTIFVQ